MKCQEALEFLSAAADGELEENVEAQFRTHLSGCSRCTLEYDLERATKFLVSRRVKHQPAPQELRQRIVDLLDRQSSGGFWKTFAGRLIPGTTGWKVGLAFTGAVAVFAVFLVLRPVQTHHSHASPVDGNVIHQTYNNYDRVLNGTFVPQIASDDPAVVNKYFTSKVNFHVTIPRAQNYKLEGGVCSHYRQMNLAHLVYTNDRDVIYIYQTRLCDALNGGALDVPPEVMRQVAATGWYFENHKPDCSLAVWVEDSTLCCAIADVERDQLVAFLTGSN